MTYDPLEFNPNSLMILKLIIDKNLLKIMCSKDLGVSFLIVFHFK